MEEPLSRFRGRVPAELAGARLDVVLARLLEQVSRVRLRALVETGHVRVDGRPALRPSAQVRAGQELDVELPPRTPRRSGGCAEEPIAVLHEDADVVVLDKPPGVVTHPSETVRGGTLSEWLAARYPGLPSLQGADRPGIVHRLDAGTSGVLVAARTAAAAESLLAQFRARTVEKEYLALVRGEPRFDSDWIERPVGRSERHPERMAVLAQGEGREASTYYEVVERLGSATLLACRPRTGRTHQVRVHLASAGLPLVGDRLYRGERGLRLAPIPAAAPPLARHALHARALAFEHPSRGERVRFEAPLASDIAALVAWLRATR